MKYLFLILLMGCEPVQFLNAAKNIKNQGSELHPLVKEQVKKLMGAKLDTLKSKWNELSTAKDSI